MSTGGSRGELVKALVDLREGLVAASLPLPDADPGAAAQLREEMLGQLSDYVLPRMTHVEAPLVAVVGGSTGTGKSTLVNSLIGRQVSAPGVLRPTTRSAVVAHHPDDAGWFSGNFILPGFTRTTTGNAEPGTLRLVADTAVPRGLALVDTPDIDSVVTSNRELATQLLSAADLWLFVTSANRYADAVPWEYLRTAAERSTAVAVVLDRVRESGSEEVRGHLARMLSDRGLGEAPLFVVPETTPTKQGLLPIDDIETVKTWLAKLAGDPSVRAAVVRQTLDGVVASFVTRIARYADALDVQHAAAERLRVRARQAYDEAVEAVDVATGDGSMLRGEVLARWQDFVGTGEIVASLESQLSGLRDRATSDGGRRAPGEALTAALEHGFEAVVVNAAAHAADHTEDAWRRERAGRAMLAEHGEALPVVVVDGELGQRARREYRSWEARISELIIEEGERKRATARLLSFGPSGLGLVLIIAVFASKAPSPNASEPNGSGSNAPGADDNEVGPSQLAGRVLEAVFGADVVAELVAKARTDLLDRVHDMVANDRARFDALLDALKFDPERVVTLRAALATVEAKR